MTPGSEALRHGAALLDLSGRGRIRVTGDDRARLLHAMTTNHIDQLKPGEGLYAFFLDAQGHILADVYALRTEDHFLLDTEASTRKTVFEHLDKYIIADDVTLEDETEQTFCIGLEGPEAHEVAALAGFPAPNHRFSHTREGEFMVASISETGAPAVRFYGRIGQRDELLRKLEGAGALLASDEDCETARIMNFKPKHGVDFGTASLPQETQQTHALHFQKGCYLGQEIVERIRSRGHVNKVLMGFSGTADHAPKKGEIVAAGGKEAGEVTSAVFVDGTFYGIAIVRAHSATPGAVIGIEGRPAILHAPAA